MPSKAQDQKRLDSLELLLQNRNVDSVYVTILVELWRTTAYSDPPRSLQYAHQIIEQSKKINFDIGVATGYQRLGIAHSYMGDNDSARANYHKALRLYEEMESPRLKGIMLYNIGIAYQDESVYDSALHYIRKAGELFEKADHTQGVGAVFESVGSIEQEKGNYRLALQDFIQAADKYEEMGDSSRLADTHIMIGDSYFLLEDFISALDYYQHARDYHHRHHDLRGQTDAMIKIGSAYRQMEVYEKARNTLTQSVSMGEELSSPWFIADATANLGQCYYDQRAYEKALPVFERSLREARKGKYTIHIASNLINIGWVHFHLDQLADAEQYGLEGLEIANNTAVKENIKSGLELLARIFEKKDDYRQALHYFTLFKATEDSIYNQDKTASIAELQTLYETEKKENEISRQQEDIKILNQQAKIDRLRKTLLGLGLVAALVMGGLVTYNFTQKMRLEKVAREREKADYEKELTYKKRELTTHTLHLVQKNKLLADLKEKLTVIRKTDPGNKREINRLIQLIKNDSQTDKDWENFKMYFEQVHEDFDTKLREKINDLTNSEMRLASLMKMNLSTKEIAAILNISPDSVNKARYRLRKKLNLSGDDSLHDFILAL